MIKLNGNSLVIGTHNSMTYLKPKKWYHWFFNPIYKCQNRTIEEQLSSVIAINGIEYNIDCFDFRIRFDKDKEPYFAHGIVGFKNKDFFETLETIDKYAQEYDKHYIIRLILEDITYLSGVMSFLAFGFKCRDKEYLNEEHNFQTDCFLQLCKALEEQNLKYLHFFQGNRKGDWAQIYNFPLVGQGDSLYVNPFDLKLHQFINSCPDETAKQPKCLEKIIPKLYAKRYNPIKSNYNQPLVDVSLYDFL